MKKSFSRLCGILLLAALTTPLHAGKVLAEVEYFYAQDNTLVGKAFNGKRVNFEYDLRGQLLAVTDAEGNDLERYTYDPAGNRLSKTIDGVTTTYRYDNANQLVSSTSDGVTTQYRYDAAGRMVQAGDKTYYYNFGNNKVSEVKQNGKTIAKFECNLDGQISKAVYGDKTEEFIWDGLALVWRSGVTYVNEPYVTGGNPILAGDDVLFNDMLGTTLAVNGNPVEMTSFGETNDSSAFFTGKPMIEELGYSFLFRDYNPSHGRWTTADPLGYPDGWNNLAYVNNWVTGAIDRLGTKVYWCTRDLNSFFWGNHHYLTIIPDNPDDFTDLKDFSGNHKGYVIAAIREKGPDGKHYLNYQKNDNNDVEAVNEYFGGDDKGWDPEFHEITDVPDGMSDTEFIRKIQAIANSYQPNTVIYDLWDENCAAWVNTLLKIAGVSETNRLKYSEFFGFDWGEEDELPRSSFTYE